MEISQLAVPAVYSLVIFLGYPSQLLLLYLEPGPLTKNEIIVANIALLFILVTYTKSVFVDPGTIPENWAEKQELGETKSASDEKEGVARNRKWCRKCDAAKPPRAHHCKECKRCIPKMDHHCPWTANCVSHATFPHFIRFLFYTTTTLSIFESLLFTRIASLWNNRNMPAYLGPSPFQLAHLFITFIGNSFMLFAIGILLIRNIWCLAVNTTTIEGWEIERHKTLLRRARHFGGYLESADGEQVRIKKQEFPYDIGILANIVQGMGTANPVAWFNPFSGTPSLASGLHFETNGFEDDQTMWPPPDPDRAYRRRERAVNADAFTFQNSNLSPEETMAAFKERQAEDAVRRRRPFLERIESKVPERESGLPEHNEEDDYVYGGEASDAEEDDAHARTYADEGEESWRNSEGERLKDFGVDEDVEFYDEQEDDIPLSELLALRKATT